MKHLHSVPVGMAMTGVERMLVSGEERDKQRQRKIEARRKHRERWWVWVIFNNIIGELIEYVIG